VNRVFTKAIVRKPCPSMVNGITTAGLGKPDFCIALEQHGRYVVALQECGLQVTVLEGDDRYPDSTFIEDAALCAERFAVITNPGASARNGEKELIRPVLRGFFQDIEEILFPGTLDAGDVMMAGDHFYIGLSERTNPDGADQLIEILNRHGLSGSTVPMGKILHLKTGLSYLEQNNLLIGGEFLRNPEFENYSRIVVDGTEAYSANSLWVNGKVLVPRGYPGTRSKIEKAGYPVIELDVSEFRNLDGGLSCLSLRF
jgi:dimethylargininase